MVNWHSDKFSFNFEWAINKGGLKVYGIDNNKYQILNYFDDEVIPDLKPALTVNNTEVFENEFVSLYPYYSFVTDINQPIIESSPKGPE